MTFLQRATTHYRRGRAALAVSAGYALLVVGTAAFAVVTSRLDPESLAGVWLIVVTLPVSALLQFLPVEGGAYAMLLTVGGLAQAWLLWLVLRGKRTT